MSASNNRHSRNNRYIATWLLISFFSSLFSTSVFADEVTSKGTVLRGKVVSFSSAGVEFETEYGKGTISIPWENIEGIKTEVPFQVLHGENQEIDAPVLNITDGKLMVGESADTATPIDMATIQSAQPIGAEGLSFAQRMQSRFRFWDGSFILGFSLSQSTVDTTGLLIALKALRNKEPTRFFLEGSYRYSTQKESDEDSTTLENELRGMARLEYDFTPRLYGFASFDAENDKVEDLKIRAIPKAGLGYRLWVQQIDETKENFLQVEAGGAYVYERFYGGDSNDFFSVVFGALAHYYLPYNSVFDLRVDYLPAINDWANDYLIRAEASLSMPLLKAISLVASAIDVYDSTPAENTDENSLFFTLGLSVGF